jgi:hypothetical protein
MNPGNYKWYTKEEVASWPEGHKKCRGCQEVLPLSSFHKQKQTLFGVNSHCKECRKPKSKAIYASMTSERNLYDRAKSRATKKGREFSITLDDIVIPENCPILGVPFVFEANHQYAPSLDRIDSSKGYVPGNVQVVTVRANTLKSNMSVLEGVKVLKHLTSLSKELAEINKTMTDALSEMTKSSEALRVSLVGKDFKELNERITAPFREATSGITKSFRDIVDVTSNS